MTMGHLRKMVNERNLIKFISVPMSNVIMYMKILYSVINLISEGRGTMEQTDQALKFVVSLEKTIKRICQDRQCDLSQNEQATLKTFLRNFCEENEVKAFLYLRLFLVCQVDPKREELYDRLVRLLIKLSNTSAETEVWTLQEG